MNTNFLLIGVLFLLVAILLFFTIRAELRIKRLFRGKKAEDLEHLIANLVDHGKMLGETAENHALNLKAIESRLTRHGRGVKLIRFNPFGDTGSNQSFAVAIMNEEGNGVVFSSLYSRERMSVFAKPILGGKSDIELTPEELSVVTDAIADAGR